MKLIGRVVPMVAPNPESPTPTPTRISSTQASSGFMLVRSRRPLCAGMAVGMLANSSIEVAEIRVVPLLANGAPRKRRRDAVEAGFLCGVDALGPSGKAHRERRRGVGKRSALERVRGGAVPPRLGACGPIFFRAAGEAHERDQPRPDH